jgi:hypothetical protein
VGPVGVLMSDPISAIARKTRAFISSSRADIAWPVVTAHRAARQSRGGRSGCGHVATAFLKFPDGSACDGEGGQLVDGAARAGLFSTGKSNRAGSGDRSPGIAHNRRRIGYSAQPTCPGIRSSIAFHAEFVPAASVPTRSDTSLRWRRGIFGKGSRAGRREGRHVSS